MTKAVSGDALTALVAKWKAKADKDWHVGHDDVEDGVWSYQHEANGAARARRDDADELAALIAAGRSAATTDLLDLQIVDDRTTRTECCGALVADTSRFCPTCGWEFRAAPAPLPAPTVAEEG